MNGITRSTSKARAPSAPPRCSLVSLEEQCCEHITITTAICTSTSEEHDRTAHSDRARTLDHPEHVRSCVLMHTNFSATKAVD